MKPTISLIVATYNWPEALKLCLLSIKRQTALPLEVIIADDGSDMRTTTLIAEIQKNFPIPLVRIWHEDLGFRKSIILNKAIKKAVGTYIVQIDGDVILESHFLEDHDTAAQPGFFVRGTRAHIGKKRIPDIYRKELLDFHFLSAGIINRFNAIRAPFLAFLVEKRRNNSNSVRGSNLAFWKADFIQVNGYNNDLMGWGHEDEELAARFINNGIWKKSIKFKAVQYHISHETSSRDRELMHSEVLQKTLRDKLATCANGVAQS